MHPLAYLTSGFRVIYETRHGLALVDGSRTQPSPATLRKSPPPRLSGSGLPTPSPTRDAERLTNNTKRVRCPVDCIYIEPRGGGLDAQPCTNRGDGPAANGARAMRSQEIRWNRAVAESGGGLRSRGRSRPLLEKSKRRTVSTQGSSGRTRTPHNEEYRKRQWIAREANATRRPQSISDDQAKNDETSRKSCPVVGVDVRARCLFNVHRSHRLSPEAIHARSPMGTQTTTTELALQKSEMRVDAVCTRRQMRWMPGRSCPLTTVALCAESCLEGR